MTETKEKLNFLKNIDSYVNLGQLTPNKSPGRVDIKMNHLGEPHFIEANLMPGQQKG